VIAHWDEAESGRAEAGHIAGEWTDLGVAAGRLDDLDYDDGEPG
jgi:hypothetical protein